MSSKRISVGILITPSDADIAAYLNSLRDSGQKPAKWLSGMLIANETGDEFPIPDFQIQIRYDSHAVLISFFNMFKRDRRHWGTLLSAAAV